MSKQAKILWGLLWLAALAGYTAAILLVVSHLAAAERGTTSGTVEHWNSLAEVQSRWTPQGWAEGCTQAAPDLLDMTCNSAGWLTKQTWSPDQPLSVSGTFRGEAASPHNQWWILVTLGTVAADTDDDSYCRWWEMHTAHLGSYGIGLLLPGCYSQPLRAADTNWHSFRMDYTPLGGERGCVRYWLDGQQVAYSCGATGSFIRVKVGDAAVFAGQPNSGELADGQFGPLTITAGSGPQPTPTVTPRPRGRAQ